MISPSELRRLTDAAIDRGRAELAAKLEEQRVAANRKRIQEESRAHGIIEQIPGRAQAEASAGRSYAIVMSLKYGETIDRHNGEPVTAFIKEDALAPQMVWKWCQDAGFKPTLESWWSGDGMDGGFNIVIHW